MDSRATGFGVWSDWPDLNDLCVRTGVSLNWVSSDSDTVAVSEDIITDNSISVRATIVMSDQQLSPDHARKHLIHLQQQRQQQHWTGLKLQGQLACLPTADHSVSHSIFKNHAVDEEIVTFTMKARLQVLPTRLNLSLWYPDTFSPHCLHHDHNTPTESLSHILNGCHVYKGMYIARHDRIVDLLVKDLLPFIPTPVKIHKHSKVTPTMFNLCNNDDVFTPISANTPDVVIVDEESRDVTILEVSCAFDSNLEEAFMSKVLKYELLREVIIQLGYKCKLLVFILYLEASVISTD